MAPPKTTPGPLQRAGNAARAVARATEALSRGEELRVAPDIATRRLAICRACPSRRYRAKGELCTHPDCGCFLQAKTRLATERCPMGHWTRAPAELAPRGRRVMSAAMFMGREAALRTLLPADGPTLTAMDTLEAARAHPEGCPSCDEVQLRQRVLEAFIREAPTLDPATRATLRTIFVAFNLINPWDPQPLAPLLDDGPGA